MTLRLEQRHAQGRQTRHRRGGAGEVPQEGAVRCGHLVDGDKWRVRLRPSDTSNAAASDTAPDAAPKENADGNGE